VAGLSETRHRRLVSSLSMIAWLAASLCMASTLPEAGATSQLFWSSAVMSVLTAVQWFLMSQGLGSGENKRTVLAWFVMAGFGALFLSPLGAGAIHEILVLAAAWLTVFVDPARRRTLAFAALYSILSLGIVFGDVTVFSNANDPRLAIHVRNLMSEEYFREREITWILWLSAFATLFTLKVRGYLSTGSSRA